MHLITDININGLGVHASYVYMLLLAYKKSGENTYRM